MAIFCVIIGVISIMALLGVCAALYVIGCRAFGKCPEGFRLLPVVFGAGMNLVALFIGVYVEWGMLLGSANPRTQVLALLIFPFWLAPFSWFPDDDYAQCRLLFAFLPPPKRLLRDQPPLFWALRGLHVAVSVGFLVGVVLAWYHLP